MAGDSRMFKWPLSLGTSLGLYEIQTQLGARGYGECAKLRTTAWTDLRNHSGRNIVPIEVFQRIQVS